MQKISQIRTFIEVRVMPFFDHSHPKSIKVILKFPEFASACKKSAQFAFIHSSIYLVAIFFYQLLNSDINM